MRALDVPMDLAAIRERADDDTTEHSEQARRDRIELLRLIDMSETQLVRELRAQLESITKERDETRAGAAAMREAIRKWGTTSVSYTEFGEMVVDPETTQALRDMFAAALAASTPRPGS